MDMNSILFFINLLDADLEYIPGILNRNVEVFFTAHDETDKQCIR